MTSSKLIPQCTVVTMFFDLSRFHGDSRNVQTAALGCKALLNTPCYMVIFADSVMMPIVREARQCFDHMTHYVKMEVEELPKYGVISLVRENREKYHPTKDARTCPETHIVQSSKPDLLLKAMEMDVFRTPMFAWLDGFTGTPDFHKIGRNASCRMLQEAINRPDPSKMYIQILNVTDKRFKAPEHKREYYITYRWVVCGCLMVMGRSIGDKICRRVNEIFQETLNAGYGHGEEMFFLEILDEFYQDIEKSYGDYHHILPNFYCTQTGFDYILEYIIKRYNQFAYYREAYDCCSKVIHDIETNPSISQNYESYWMQILFQQYLAAYYYRPESTFSIVSRIVDLCEIYPRFRQEYNRLAGLYDSQLVFVNYLKPTYDIIFCIFGSIGSDKYRNEIESILRTWATMVESVDKKILILFFLKKTGDVSSFVDSNCIRFIYLDNIFDDYLSAADKQYRGLKYIYEHYNASWVYVCGTDTFVHLQRLVDKLNTYDSNQPYYIGGNDCVRHVASYTIPFHSGGPGFVFSHVLLKQIYPRLRTFQSMWNQLCYQSGCYSLIPACDVSFAYLVQPFAIFETLASSFFNANYLGKAYNNNIQLHQPLDIHSPEVIACHHMTPTNFNDLFTLLSI